MTIPKLKPKKGDMVMGGSGQPIATAAVMGNVGVLSRPTRQLISTKGKVVNTPLEDAHAVDLFQQMPETNNKFVSSLQAELKKGKQLSPDQMVWVHEYAIGYLKEKTFTSQEVGNPLLLKITELLEGAIKLKNPKIRLMDREKMITLFKSSETSRYPNTIAIYCDRVYFGRIENSVDGNGNSAIFRKSRSCPDWVEKLILDFAENPVEVAKNFARLTGNCCFCNMQLTDEKSIQEGYGPICANHYGLPWGNKRR
jgi:hypothetical protein